jgi:acylphosphatase
MVTRQIRVSGRVQGVGYRDALREQAEAAAVTGWVRNRKDGTVEALLQGDAESVEAVVSWARRGPPGSRVSDVVEQPPDSAFARAYPRFERWPSA